MSMHLYFNSPKAVDPYGNLLKVFDSVGTDIINNANNADKYNYTHSKDVQNTLQSGDISKIMGLDTSRLTADAAKGLATTLALSKAKQQQTLFNQSQQDRQRKQNQLKALDLSNKLLSKPRQEVYGDLNANNNADLLTKYAAMAYTPEELKATKGINISGIDKNGNYIGYDDLAKALSNNPTMLSSIITKSKAQQAMSDVANNNHRLETRPEQYTRVMNQVEANGYTPTQDMVKRGDTLKALDIKARNTKLAGINSTIKALETKIRADQNMGAKARDSGNGYSGRRSINYKGRTYKSGVTTTHKDYIRDKEKEVTFLGALGLPIGDAGDVQAWDKQFSNKGYPENKKRYLIDGLIDKGVLDTSLYGPEQAEGKKQMADLLKQYDIDYGKYSRSYTNSKKGTNQAALSDSRLAAEKLQLAAAQNKAAALGLTASEAQRAANIRDILKINTEAPFVSKKTVIPKTSKPFVSKTKNINNSVNDAFLNDHMGQSSLSNLQTSSEVNPSNTNSLFGNYGYEKPNGYDPNPVSPEMQKLLNVIQGEQGIPLTHPQSASKAKLNKFLAKNINIGSFKPPLTTSEIKDIASLDDNDLQSLLPKLSVNQRQQLFFATKNPKFLSAKQVKKIKDDVEFKKFGNMVNKLNGP